MRRQNGRLAQKCEQGLRIVLEGGERVGVEDDGGGARQHGGDQILGCGPDAAARTNDDGIEPLVASADSASPPAPANGLTMIAVSAAALIGTASGGLATLTSPAPTRSAPRAASRAAPVACAGPLTTTQ